MNLLKVPDPTQAGGREVTARELLADALPRIQEDLTDPETRMRLLQVVAEVNQNLGLLEGAYHARNQLIILSTELHGRRSLETAEELDRLSVLQRNAREFEHALEAAEECLDIRRELLPAGHLDIGFALKEVAMSHRDLRQTELAREELREAMTILEANLPEDDSRRVHLMADYAYILRSSGELEESEALYRETIDRMRQDPDNYRQSRPAALNNLAYLLKRKEEYEEAEALYEEAVAGIEAYHGRAHPQTLMYRNNLAATKELLGKNEEARVLLEEAIPLSIQLHGEDHWRVGRAWRSLGVLLFRNGEYADSAEAFHSSGEVFAAGLGPEHLWTATSGALEATSLHLAGDDDQAERTWREAARLLDTPDARVDRNVQGMLKLIRDNLPEGQEAWKARLEVLIPAEG